MEYLIGSLATLLAVYVAARFSRKLDKTIKFSPKVILSQSRQNAILQPIIKYAAIMMEPNTIEERLVTQATKYFDKNHKRVVLTDKYAYWITNTGLVVADLVNGEIVQESQRGVDIMSADAVQLEYIENIVNALTEGTNDESSDTGN